MVGKQQADILLCILIVRYYLSNLESNLPMIGE